MNGSPARSALPAATYSRFITSVCAWLSARRTPSTWPARPRGLRRRRPPRRDDPVSAIGERDDRGDDDGHRDPAEVVLLVVQISAGGHPAAVGVDASRGRTVALRHSHCEIDGVRHRLSEGLVAVHFGAQHPSQFRPGLRSRRIGLETGQPAPLPARESHPATRSDSPSTASFAAPSRAPPNSFPNSDTAWSANTPEDTSATSATAHEHDFPVRFTHWKIGHELRPLAWEQCQKEVKNHVHDICWTPIGYPFTAPEARPVTKKRWTR